MILKKKSGGLYFELLTCCLTLLWLMPMSVSWQLKKLKTKLRKREEKDLESDMNENWSSTINSLEILENSLRFAKIIKKIF